VNTHRVDAGTLELGGGLETLVRAALENMPVGGELEIVTASRGVAFELPAWARIAGHQHVGDEAEGPWCDPSFRRANPTRQRLPPAR
jgi:TusA-related sulfurtransferase